MTTAALRANHDTPEKILREVFGFGAFRDAQADIIAHVSDGGDALVLMVLIWRNLWHDVFGFPGLNVQQQAHGESGND